MNLQLSNNLVTGDRDADVNYVCDCHICCITQPKATMVESSSPAEAIAKFLTSKENYVDLPSGFDLFFGHILPLQLVICYVNFTNKQESCRNWFGLVLTTKDRAGQV